MSPSKKLLSAGQAGKFADVIIARLEKSGLPHEPTQYVLEHEGLSIAEVIESEVRRRVEVRIRAISPHILKLPRRINGYAHLGMTTRRIGERTRKTLDGSRIVNKSYLQPGEDEISEEEFLSRVKADGAIQLDIEDADALISEKEHQTLEYLFETKGIDCLLICGSFLVTRNGGTLFHYISRTHQGYWVEGTQSMGMIPNFGWKVSVLLFDAADRAK